MKCKTQQGHEIFLALDALIQQPKNDFTQTATATAAANFSVLQKKGYVKENMPTKQSENAVQPHKVERAIFLAAGKGLRMAPLTFTTPKPLVKVNGVRMIDTMLDALLAANISEIYIVRGYLKECFDVLKEKYPMIQFIENPDYEQANNISSAYYARHLLENAYVLEGDLYVKNPAVITEYQSCSNYCSVPVAECDDWCLMTENDRIYSMQLTGKGENCHHMLGISYWTKEDGKKLAKDIEQAYLEDREKQQGYWDYVPLKWYAENYHVHVRTCTSSDVVELDNYFELQALDNSYK